MKPIKVTKKLVVKKSTVSNLSLNELKKAYGGTWETLSCSYNVNACISICYCTAGTCKCAPTVPCVDIIDNFETQNFEDCFN